MIVVDASAVVDRLLRGHGFDDDLVAPDLMPVECASAFARLERGGLLERVHADACVAAVRDLPVTLMSDRTLLPAAWSMRSSVAIADAFYVACALATGVPLLTHDRRLARSAERLGVVVQS